MKVLFLTQFGWMGGSSRIQVLQFLPLLQKEGIEAVSRPIYNDWFYKIQMGLTDVPHLFRKVTLVVFLVWALLKKIYYTLTAWRFAAVVVQKETFPASLFFVLRSTSRKLIYEIDDTIFEINPFLKRGALELILLKYQARLCKAMMKRAEIVVAENEYLANEARKHNNNVYVLSAPIDTEKFHPLPKKETATECVVGWIGSPSTTYMLEEIKSVFKRLGEKNSSIILKTVGARKDFSIEKMKLVAKNWSSAEELEDLNSFDIGIMPLNDDPFNRGRLGYKMIQYMAVGVPVIAADVGLNRTVVNSGQNGYLVKNEDEWVEKIEHLATHPDVRRVMGLQARKDALDQYSLTSKVKVYLDVLKK